MAGRGYAVFDTAIGRCGIVWSDTGILGVQLPEARFRALLAGNVGGITSVRLLGTRTWDNPASRPSGLRGSSHVELSDALEVTSVVGNQR